MAQLSIQEYEVEQKEQLKHLLHVCSEDYALLNVVNSKQWEFAYTAYSEEDLVGFLVAWTSGIHPYCMYFRVLSHPLYHGLNIEKKMLSKVEEQKVNALPLQTSIWDISVNLKGLYTSNGFKEIRRTYMPSLKMSDVGDYLPLMREETRIKSLTEILSNQDVLKELALLVKRNYETMHVANPAKELEVEKWEEMILSDDLVSQGSFIYLDKSEKNIVAYSFLHESEKNNAVELGWCGADNTKNKELVFQLIVHQINYAVRHDVQTIIGEFDTTDVYAMGVLKRFPFAPCPTWITYQKS